MNKKRRFSVLFGVGALALALATGCGGELVAQGQEAFEAAGQSLIWEVGMNPHALVAVDLNADGLTDLATANEGGGVSVLLRRRNGSFAREKRYLAGAAPTALATADLNRDGRTDLVVANFSSNDVSVLLGNGDGTFRAAAEAATARGPEHIAVADFNGDGISDLAVVAYYGSQVSMLVGRGDGTFEPAIDRSYVRGDGAVHAAAADFDHNGTVDLAITLERTFVSAARLAILAGQGDGSFQLKTSEDVSGDHYQIVQADLNRDGHADLAVAQGASGVAVRLGRGDGAFSAPVLYAASNPLAANAFLATVDLNGDGAVDLVTSSMSRTVNLLLGRGDGTLAPAIAIESPVGVGPMAGGYFDGNSRLDLFVASYNNGGTTVSVLLNPAP